MGQKDHQEGMMAAPPRILDRKVLHAGAHIFREGDDGDRAYLVQQGTVEIVRRRADGTEVILGEITKGGIFGEMALVDDQPRMAAARALTGVTLLVVTREQFREKLDAADPFIRALLKIFVHNIRQVSSRI
ncbi:cyclic nucleotide-binding domain-containing protein [Novispirillum sp. DQ9]|uniref:cyclic nucleotide-binding domain-containing protein n=1 Tax=Novispirillum sp. DQ9 TaxID=3398612 RepID=UPI003C79820C